MFRVLYFHMQPRQQLNFTYLFFVIVDEFYKFYKNRFIGVYFFRRTKNLKILKKSQPSKKMPLKLLREISRRFVSREKLDYFCPRVEVLL